MAAPTFVSENEGTDGWDSGTSPETTGSFAVQIGDVLALLAGREDNNTFAALPTNSNTGHTWTLQENQNGGGSFGRAAAWTAISAVAQSNTVSLASGTGSSRFGTNCVVFRGSDGIGAAESTSVAGAAPSLAITTTQDNSAIVVVSVDWNAADGASRTWRTVNGITPTAGNGLELTYFRNSAAYTVYVAYYSDAGAAGAKTVGLSAPGSQNYSIAAIEIKGTASQDTPELRGRPNGLRGATQQQQTLSF